ncbi:phosphoribosylformylglycinamidine synthase [Magnetococcales bacterium HHB-1]
MRSQELFFYDSGAEALSKFRLDKLWSSMAPLLPDISGISARFMHFALLSRELTVEERRILTALLTYGPESIGRETQSAGQLLAIPRPGSISPWSSKATDIAQRCGLDCILRLERGIRYRFNTPGQRSLTPEEQFAVAPLLHDRMTQVLVRLESEAKILFKQAEPKPLVRLKGMDKKSLQEANRRMGLALSSQEIDYLLDFYRQAGRAATDVELMMFAQANSEHCRHKIFNAQWVIDGDPQNETLFGMIRHTHNLFPADTVVAYSDNSAVIADGVDTRCYRFYPEPEKRHYDHQQSDSHILMKVETHNHPTAISPYPGAATGSGGEIRDEGATGRGGWPKAGLTGFSVSNLSLPEAKQPWEGDYGKPDRIVSALDIMLEAPIGAAAFNNEFGRPNIFGYFRTFEMLVSGEMRGYHKPIMVAGGMGMVRDQHVQKQPLRPGDLIIQLGGPAMLIGLGGGAASSQASGQSDETLDFASVQRENAEMERRCQEVLNCCWQLGCDNPIQSLHDIGAGGLSNAVPELIHDGGVGGRLDLRHVPNDDHGMSPMEIWCNEAQERYMLAIRPEDLARFKSICLRERCPFAVLGEATEEKHLKVIDSNNQEVVVDMPLDVLLGKPPKMIREVERVWPELLPLQFPQSGSPTKGDVTGIDLNQAIYRVLKIPAVADKTFLVTIGDRSVTGLVSRDPMVGPWQVPVADVAVTARDFVGYRGEAMTMGERTPVALISGPASARLAIGEAVTNMAAAFTGGIEKIKLSANWMSPAGHRNEDANLFDTVRTVGMTLCPQLGISVPVGKDSMSMKTVWQQDGEDRSVTAPLSLIISAFAPVQDIRLSVTPVLKRDEDSVLILVDLGLRKNRLGGSALAQAYDQMGEVSADLDDPEMLNQFFSAMQQLISEKRILAYHDRSDGGLFVTLCEMAFAGRVGLKINLDGLGDDPASILFAEELGAVLQIRRKDQHRVLRLFEGCGFIQEIGAIGEGDHIRFFWQEEILIDQKRVDLHRAWSETTWRMQSLRDNPQCALEEYDRILDEEDPGLHAKVAFFPETEVREEKDLIHIPGLSLGVRPKVAILREQGVNGHVEMAAAFHRAGFKAVDVMMHDFLTGQVNLDGYNGLVACGGFSFGDVLGAGEGWAKSILFNETLSTRFAHFLRNDASFALGVCNGCQMLSRLKSMIPGSEAWPRFVRNKSEQFESRVAMVEIMDSPSIFFQEMAGSRLPIVCAHGEGRAEFSDMKAAKKVLDKGMVALRYVDNRGQSTETYPANPNGSPLGITGLSSEDGRVTIMMPHPERVFRVVQNSWYPDHWSGDSPWMRMFHNARRWLT